MKWIVFNWKLLTNKIDTPEKRISICNKEIKRFIKEKEEVDWIKYHDLKLNEEIVDWNIVTIEWVVIFENWEDEYWLTFVFDTLTGNFMMSTDAE